MIVWLAVLFCRSQSAAAELWVTAYYPGTAARTLPASEIGLSALTHIIHFALVPNPDGSLDETGNGIEATNIVDLLKRAHAAGKKVLICAGGAGSGRGFQGASSASHLATFVANLARFMAAWDYDGIDLDWEPLLAADSAQFTNLVLELRSAMNAISVKKLLTAAVSAYPAYGDPPDSECILLASLQTQFDQINIMTYDLAGAYAGWVTWFNSPIYDGGQRFPSTGNLLPSIAGSVNNFVKHGVAPGKLGVGVAFYGDVWAGEVSLPRQSWKAAPTVTQVAYRDIMASYYKPNRYHWDTNAQAAYLSLDRPGVGGDKFISYDDERTCEAKVKFARENRLGGIMIWQLAQGHLSDRPAGRSDPLVRAIRDALSSARQTR